MSYLRNNLQKGSGKKVLFHKIAYAFLYYAKLSFTAEYTAEKDCTVLFSVMKTGNGYVPSWATKMYINGTELKTANNASLVTNWHSTGTGDMTSANGNYIRKTAFTIKAGDTVKITASAPLSTSYGMPGIVVNVDIIG